MILNIFTLDIILIILVPFVITLIIIFYKFKRRLNLKKIFYENICRFPKLGAYVLISGKLGAGKTILLYSISHIANFHLFNLLNKRMSDISLLMPEFPFNYYNKFYQELKNNNKNYEEIVDIIISDLFVTDFKSGTFKYKVNGLIFDYSKTQHKIKMLKDYYKLFDRVLSNNFILSNIEIFNHYTCSYSLQFRSKWFEVKNNTDFPIDDYTFIAYDESAIDKSNKNSISKLNDDTGVDIVERLLRNASKESIYYYTTLQDADRMIALEREIATSYIYVIQSYMIGQSRFYMNLINKLVDLNSLLYRIFLKLFVKKDNRLSYQDSCNYFRKKAKKYELLQRKHLSKTFVWFDVAIYNNLDNVGKKITADMEDQGNYYYTFCVPQQYAYCSGSSFTFAPFFDYLRKRSTIKSDKLGRTSIDIDYINTLLSKYTRKEKGTQSNENWTDTISNLYE